MDNNVIRPSWDETFMEIAKVVAKRSEDPHTKVGAVLVKDKCVLGVGYNGTPRNCSYDFDWHTDEKYTWVIHAEMNAVANASYIGTQVKGAEIYVTLSPCHDCIKLLVQHGISTVYYLEEYKDVSLTKKIAEACGLKLICLKK